MKTQQQLPSGKCVTNITSVWASANAETKEVLRMGIYAGIYIIDAPRQEQIAERIGADPKRAAQQIKLFLRGIISEEELRIELTP